MFFSLSILAVSVILFSLVNPVGAVCSNGASYRSVVLDFAKNTKDICHSEEKTIHYVQKQTHKFCCAFDFKTCKQARDVYIYFDTERRKDPSIENKCYYNFFILFFASCDCQSKIQEESSQKDMSCGISKTHPTYSITPFIIGGQKSMQCEFPWMAQYIVRDYLCGGVLIDAKHILTAAHCTKNGNIREMMITLGIIDRNKPDIEFGIEKITVHPHYRIDRYAYYNDIAILKLSEEVKFSKCIQPICLPKGIHIIKNMTNCFTAGWGKNEYNQLPNILHKVRVPILSKKICEKYVRGFQPTHLCAGYLQGGKDACAGDSGGPLMCPVNGQWVLAGIVSFGLSCARPYNPGVYTNVKYHMRWILDHLD